MSLSYTSLHPDKDLRGEAVGISKALVSDRQLLHRKDVVETFQGALVEPKEAQKHRRTVLYSLFFGIRDIYY
ncbi:hypothetical protein A2304_02920 [Candidatus Uhrbacteria bacterium RIFOXYB2_FULL_57_15]|uniref:Uncharacterized protein n=1 Tax=Candidatus Uhrbacteria bacterium RIFOXYB2_FULL_57_15 TaxID=1802422 RepID=A0A1F7W761_9BACT|nr:MAG: hypothetical protein A2304_02920 [Candidatus Uhrbacteria bacterium RIFOXYB2_FULL_57_15]OGL99979.1 MAG: hypothetical protein A2501_02565 [Candidatus Uhrbacteria bacterium RIFOXYC12_FULL_57_11]